MALTITASSTDQALTTTSQLRSLVLGATATSTALDSRFSDLVMFASKWAERYIGQPLTAQTYRETVPGYGLRRLMLSRTPLLAVNALYTSTSTADATVVETSEFIVEDRDAGLLARDQGFSWSATLQWPGSGSFDAGSLPLLPSPLPGQEYRPWLVDYVAGWTYAGLSTSSPNWSTEGGTTSTGRTVPEDVEYAVLLRAQALFDNNEGISSETLGDISVSYITPNRMADTLPMYEQLLAPYRRVF